MKVVKCLVVCFCTSWSVAAWGQQAHAGAGDWWSQNKPSEASQQAEASPQPAAASSGPEERPAESAVSRTAPTMPLSSVRAEDFDCIEVKTFDAMNDFISSKEDARAATIPVEKLQALQREVAGQIPERVSGMKSTMVGAGTPACPDPQRALVLGGRIIDYKKGNQALRYFVGFGAGAQKFSVLARVTRKSDGALVGEGEVTDRKIGGWLGGQADKGMQDFAEKVANFLKAALRAK